MDENHNATSLGWAAGEKITVMRISWHAVAVTFRLRNNVVGNPLLEIMLSWFSRARLFRTGKLQQFDNRVNMYKY